MPPPHRPKHSPPPHRAHRGASVAFVDAPAVDAALVGLIPDARDRALVVRCLLEEGPAHHRGANWILISLLAKVAGELAPVTDGAPVPMRLPPHVKPNADAVYPVMVPRAPLEALSDDPADVDRMVDCLVDGPPQHALANVVMVSLIDALRRRLASPTP